MSLFKTLLITGIIGSALAMGFSADYEPSRNRIENCQEC